MLGIEAAATVGVRSGEFRTAEWSEFNLDAIERQLARKASKTDYRMRVGAYRVLFNREDTIRIIEIVRVAHRKEAYQ